MNNALLAKLQQLAHWFRQHALYQRLVMLGGVFIVPLALVGYFNDVLQFKQTLSDTFFPTPNITLSYQTAPAIDANRTFNLKFTAPTSGSISLWNQAGSEQPIKLILPNQGATHLNPHYHGETLPMNPTITQGTEHYILLWTSQSLDKHLPDTQYDNQTAFDQAINTLKNAAPDLEIASVAIPVVITKP